MDGKILEDQANSLAQRLLTLTPLIIKQELGLQEKECLLSSSEPVETRIPILYLQTQLLCQSLK